MPLTLRQKAGGELVREQLTWRSQQNLHWRRMAWSGRSHHDHDGYDTVSDVVESGVHWGSNFQIGSRVLKICFKPILMHIYGMQYDFMHRSC